MNGLVTIRWEGPFALETIHNHEVREKKGLYTISRVWADRETILYIGQTKRTFEQRMQEHNKAWLVDLRGQIKLRFGLIELDQFQKWSDKRLDAVEALLITTHLPQYNAQYTRYYTKRDRLDVRNIGRKGKLKPFISTDDLEWG